VGRRRTAHHLSPQPDGAARRRGGRRPAAFHAGRPDSITWDDATEHASGRAGRDDFLACVRTALDEAERALHDGDPAPRRALGRSEQDELVTALGTSFSDCTSYAFDLLAQDPKVSMPRRS
jgi:hypothetical protein